MFKYPLIALFLLTTLSATAQRRIYDDDVKELITRMEGAFDNQEQYGRDSAKYDNISLHIARIWEGKKVSKGGYWLYAEQAMTKTMEQPIRQSVYHITRKDNETIESKVYEIPNAPQYAGGWQDEKKLKGLQRDSLKETPGCSLFLKLNEDGNFWGSTPGKECAVAVSGASYLTSEVVIYPNMIVSLDRGWDADDKQIWGPEKGGYRFSKWSVLSTSKDD